MLTGQLKFVVMQALSHNDLSGYSLIKKIQQDTGCWKPSPGSIYPLLEDLLKSNYVTVERKDRRKIYKITKKGRLAFSGLSSKRNEFIESLIDGLKVFGSFHGQKDVGFMLEMLEQTKKGQMPFIELNPEIAEFRTALYELHKTNRLSRHKKEIKSILRQSITEMKELK